MLCRTSDENKPHILKIPYCILLGHKKKCGQIIEFTIWAVYNHSSTKFQLQYTCRLLEQFPKIPTKILEAKHLPSYFKGNRFKTRG